ncbi:hypothetical protein BGZ51_006744 [Haplosporangium sp. Z 767]|nr:hypothetical protein BGZ50_006766 [Haplosporangium sp. Z 11]KAF9179683.1 hypothetical protein BGZ51_006744 [Haplosporangium sp. Z 767]
MDHPLDSHPTATSIITTTTQDPRTCARTKALDFLKGLRMADVLLPDPESCLRPSLQDCIQPFIVSEDAILSYNTSNSSHYSRDSFLSLKPTTRRVHACIHHSTVPPTLAPTAVAPSSPSSSVGEHSSNNNSDNTPGRRYYFLRDVTEMHNLAVAARNGIRARGRFSHRQQRSSLLQIKDRQRKQEYSPKAASALSSAAYLPNRDSGVLLEDGSWSSTTTSSPSASNDPGLLILQVSRFGTIDHAFAIPQMEAEQDGIDNSEKQASQSTMFLAQDRAAIDAMTSNALMTYVHPQDLSALCKGIDQVCKALYTVFRARWRVDALQSDMPSSLETDAIDAGHDDLVETTQEECDAIVYQGTTGFIDFQGEQYEEWVDPTALDAAQESSEGEYSWAEITGVLSNGNPILVVRPLTVLEIEEQEASVAMAAKSKAHHHDMPPPLIHCTSYATLVGVDSDEDEDDEDDDDSYLQESDLESELTMVMDEQCSLDWKTQKIHARKRMEIEEAQSLLYQSNVPKFSDLTSVVSRPSSAMSMLSSSSSATLTAQATDKSHSCHRHYHQGHHTAVGGITLLVTFSPTLSLSMPVFSSIALDAWKQWIQTVHLTRDQFRAWCEYLLDAGLGQMIDGVSLGLTFIGCDPRPPTRHPIADKNQQWAHEYTDSMSLAQQQMTSCHYSRRDHHDAAAKLSGLHRAGKVLEANYPAIEGVVRQIGRSWIGHRIMVTSRLEERLDVVADQVVDWWESENRVATLTSSVPLLNTLTAYTPLARFSRPTSA